MEKLKSRSRGRPPGLHALEAGGSVALLDHFMSPLPHQDGVPGTSLEDFEVKEELGRGSHGVVYKVKSHVDQREYVLKKVSMKLLNERQRQRAVSEVLMLRRMSHPNIIRYEHWFTVDDVSG